MSALGKLSLIGLIPLLSCVLFTLIIKRKNIDYTNIKYQVLLGLFFGFCSILGTEFGVSINGAVINIRDASALCAGLIFGPISGLIAGLIGGIERWFAIYWGAGSYTRVACSISTIVIGLIGGFIRKRMFNNKMPPVFSTLILSICTEVFHMMMVFFTNLNDPVNAFSVVRSCSALMIGVNSLVVTLSVLFVRYIKGELFDFKKEKIHISDVFNKQIGVLILIAFIITSLFNYRIQDSISVNNCENILKLTQNDVLQQIKDNNDEKLLNITYQIKNELSFVGSTLECKTKILLDLCDKYDVSEINLVDRDGIICSSSNMTFIGFDMKSGNQSNEFMALVNGTKYYVQEYQPIAMDASINRKYAGVSITWGFIQVGYNYDKFKDSLSIACSTIAKNRHVNNSGYVIIADSNKKIISDYFENYGNDITTLGLVIPDNYDTNMIYECDIYDVNCYYMISNVEGYYVISIVTREEIEFERDISVYLNTFLEVLVFGLLFIQIYFIIKRNISNKIKIVNNSLKLITSGNLNEIVDVKSSKEFEDLSNGINETVSSLKYYINEAEQRIANELHYAKEIQLNSLPSVFPPFPGVEEFDIYASMNAAKEVGGDFYDFYMEGKHKIAFVVADVSGKGIPAALFMMKAKALIKTYVSIGISPADVLINTNFNLCDGNEAGMFVTCFLAYLDTKTGLLEVANAGHNPPCIKHKNGEYEYLKVKSGFVLGGMEGTVYKDTLIQLEQGDEIFLYTDGVTEATNKNNELFGEDRLLYSLNQCKELDSQDICTNIKYDVDDFVGEAPQFDDITMLSLRYTKKYEEN